MDYIIVECPHCKDYVFIFKKELNCHIFRHGIMKKTLKQIDPHLDKKSCDELIKNNLIHGCGKPFKVVNDKAIICDYI